MKRLFTFLTIITVLFAMQLQAETTSPEEPENNTRNRFRQREPQNRMRAVTRATDEGDWQRQTRKQPEESQADKDYPPPYAQQAFRGRPEGFRDSYRDIMRRRNDEFIEWLRENFPSEAEKFDIAAGKDPDMAFRDLMPVVMKYRDIFEAEKKNPELATLMKNDIELHERRNEVLQVLKATEDEAEKDKLQAELEQIIAARFDLILEKRRLRCQELRDRLKQLAEEIEKQEADIEELNSQRDEQIEKRIEQLISSQDKALWD
jgi:tRNA/tmRNA/rRNA uracil-C5-methylase (TrmA/RlmC/RlmD family)